jgi:hypothetical protein
MTLAPAMMQALRSVRDGGHVTRAEYTWLKSEYYINDAHELTLKGLTELNADDNMKGDEK